MSLVPLSSKDAPAENIYAELLSEIKQRVRKAQSAALRAVNTELIGLYWDIGRLIVERQQGESWGKSVVARLAHDLQAERPGVGGFSARNLWYMREFYTQYHGNPKLQPLVAEISWSHNLVILERCTTDLEREFYLKMTRRFGWSKRTLQAKIEAQTFRRTFASQANFEEVLNTPASTEIRLTLKDEYTFDFLDLADEHTERELETAILANVGPFLREMGGVFAFVGSQYPLEVGGQQYFIDLLLYNRALRALVPIELKRGQFLPEYVGKMQFYLAALDDLVRKPDEHASIGIILCKSRNKVVVEYALRESKRPIGVAGYHTVSELPRELESHFPSPDQLERLLG